MTLFQHYGTNVCVCLFVFLYRVKHSHDIAAFHNLFKYLENNEIMKDKARTWECIQAITDKTFKLFLEAKAQQVADRVKSHYNQA